LCTLRIFDAVSLRLVGADNVEYIPSAFVPKDVVLARLAARLLAAVCSSSRREPAAQLSATLGTLMKTLLRLVLQALVLLPLQAQIPTPTPEPTPPPAATVDPLVDLQTRQSKVAEEIATIDKRLADPEITEAATAENKALRDSFDRLRLILSQHISTVARKTDLKNAIEEAKVRFKTITETGLDKSPPYSFLELEKLRPAPQPPQAPNSSAPRKTPRRLRPRCARHVRKPRSRRPRSPRPKFVASASWPGSRTPPANSANPR
jgi:hypothetical protein